jgi:phosphoserine phosphatase
MNIALSSLKGKTRDEVEHVGRLIFERTIAPNINEAGLMEMKKKSNEGYGVIILSGAFDFILKPFCDFYGVEQWNSTRIAYSNGICTGKLDGVELLGEAKCFYLQNSFSQTEINWVESCAYSDELTDLPLFSMVGSRFFIIGDSGRPPSLPEGIQCVYW